MQPSAGGGGVVHALERREMKSLRALEGHVRLHEGDAWGNRSRRLGPRVHKNILSVAQRPHLIQSGQISHDANPFFLCPPTIGREIRQERPLVGQRVGERV